MPIIKTKAVLLACSVLAAGAQAQQTSTTSPAERAAAARAGAEQDQQIQQQREAQARAATVNARAGVGLARVTKRDALLSDRHIRIRRSGNVARGAQGSRCLDTTAGTIRVRPEMGGLLCGRVRGQAGTRHSPFFMTREQYNSLSSLPAHQIANRLGLPAEQATRGSQLGLDVYSMKPVSGSNPTVFASKVAPVQQGGYSTAAGAQQVLVPNRHQWTDPNASRIGEIRGSR